MTIIQSLLDQGTGLKSARRQWDNHWQDIAEHFDPNRSTFTEENVTGERKHDHLYDSTPLLAKRQLTGAFGTLIKPKGTRWFNSGDLDVGLNEIDENKAWFQAVDERLWNAIYHRKAKFIERSGQTDNELITYGTGYLFMGESAALDGFLFKNIALKNGYIDVSEDGDVDTIFIVSCLFPRQAAQRYGEKNIGQATRDRLKDTRATRTEFWHVIKPRTDRDIRIKDDLNMPWASFHIDVDSNHMIGEGGYHEFPVVVPRWDLNADEMYGRSIAMLALPDAGTLQAQGKTLLIAGQKAADPPLLAVDDSIIGAARSFPGGITYTDGEAWAQLNGRPPVQPMDLGKNIPIGREMQNDTRDQIWRAFLRNVLNLPVEGPQMTAFEVASRKEEFVREIGPVFDKQEGGYLAPVAAERGFNIMERAGAFPPRPESLLGRKINFTFRSPVEQVRKQIEAINTSNGIQTMEQVLLAQPETMDNIDGDAMMRDLPDTYGMPQKWLRSKDDVVTLRQQRAEAQQAAEAAEDIRSSPAAQEAIVNELA